MTDNVLYYGDNLDVLREHIPPESVDLIYLDPPFNSNRNYNVLFKDESGKESESQIVAFEDTWHWNEAAERTYHDLVLEAPERVGSQVAAFRQSLGTNQVMAYLVMMAIRLVELHRVLKTTGSIYLHCDPTASHYLKVLMDAVFGAENYRNELIWYYGGRGAKAIARQFPRNHDVILFYSKRDELHFYSRQYTQRVFTVDEARKRGFRQDDLGRWFKTAPRGDYTDESVLRLETEGRIHRTKTGSIRVKYFLKEEGGRVVEEVHVDDTWLDIPDAMHIGNERLGYPTQKPEALLERIIRASSNEGGTILDPFCGCGTAVAVAQKLGRRWIGIDITHLSIALQKYRLEAMFPGIQFKVIGEPTDIGSACQLAHDDRYQFQWWALSLVRAKPLGGDIGSKTGKKGSDKGIDGVINFLDDTTGKPKQVLAQVKSGKVKSGDIRDLVGTVDREGAPMGAFISLEEPSRDMLREALSAGFYYSPGWKKDYPRIQVLSVAQLMQANGAHLDCPPSNVTFQQAPRAKGDVTALTLPLG
jgi:site-specific DNA-methyltransferase (adenine-specific)